MKIITSDICSKLSIWGIFNFVTIITCSDENHFFPHFASQRTSGSKKKELQNGQLADDQLETPPQKIWQRLVSERLASWLSSKLYKFKSILCFCCVYFILCVFYYGNNSFIIRCYAVFNNEGWLIDISDSRIFHHKEVL